MWADFLPRPLHPPTPKTQSECVLIAYPVLKGAKIHIMNNKYDFYGGLESFDRIVLRIVSYIEDKLHDTVKIMESKIEIIETQNSKTKITVAFPEPERNIEYYQHGLNRMSISVDSDQESSDIDSYISKLSHIFTPEEEKHLSNYTPWLHKLVKKDYFDNRILSDCLVIFREHSLISVYNIFAIFKKFGLKPENTVYYSKGDRCRNIYRIEESFKDKGYGVFVLSPFESITTTGRSEDEKNHTRSF